VRKLATIGIAIIAVLVALITWDLYNAAPWTRDGSVRVQVANVAPQISGRITELRIVDNQFVHKGDILYVIEPSISRSRYAQTKQPCSKRWRIGT
jgi:multidrug resistance efflux pump